MLRTYSDVDYIGEENRELPSLSLLGELSPYYSVPRFKTCQC